MTESLLSLLDGIAGLPLWALVLAVAFVVAVAAIHAVPPVAAGTLRMPVRKFLAWSAIGALSWATLYVSVGATAGASFREAGENLAGATLAVFGVAALAAPAVWLRNHRRRVDAATTTATTALAGTSTGSGTGGTGGSGVRVAAALASPTAGPCDGRGDRRAA